MKKILHRVLASVKGNKLGKETYPHLLKLMFELFQLSQKEGVLALESHIEHPEKSAIISKFPEFSKDPYLLSFLTDTFRLVLIGGITPPEIEALMDTDIETHRIRVTLATRISEERCKAINLGYMDPATIHLDEWNGRENEGILLVPRAGEMLYRIKGS